MTTRIKTAKLATALVVSVTLVLGACSLHSNSARIPAASGINEVATVESLDTKFETYWHNNAEAETKSIQDIGKVIGSFVQQEAAIHQSWKTEFEQLSQKSQNQHLSFLERDKLKALTTIVQDLPDGQGFATRDVHRRPQGCFAARVAMNSYIPADLQKGLFVAGKSYDAIVRFSNGNPRNLQDFAPDARGMAVKLLDEGTLPKANDPVGARLFANRGQPGIDAAAINAQTRLDLLAINFPVFFVNDPADYTRINEAFLSLSKNPRAMLPHKIGEFFSVYLRGLDTWQRELALNVNGSLITDVLGESYWSMMSYRLGDLTDPDRTAIKYKFKPCASNLTQPEPEWTKVHEYAAPFTRWSKTIPRATIQDLDQDSQRYYLRKKVYSVLNQDNWPTQATTPHAPLKCFELQVQRYLNTVSTPIEDTTEIWLENTEQQKAWAEKFAGNLGLIAKPGERAARKQKIMERQISAPVTIAKIELYPVDRDEAAAVANGESPNRRECEDLSFNPWNQVPSAHKPLGIVGRMRKAAYSASRDTRHRINGVH